MNKTLVTSLFALLASFAFASAPSIPSGGGGGSQPGGGGNQPDQPGGGGSGGGGGSFTYDTFLTDSTISGGCIVYDGLLTGYVSGTTAITIPATVTDIADGAFAGNASVTTIDATAATGITELPDSFAAGCDSLTSATLASAVTAVGASAFTMDAELATFTGAGVTTIGDYAFFGCKSLVLDEDSGFASVGESALRTVSYTTDDGAVYRTEAAPLVAWLKAGGTVASSLTQPTSYATDDLKTWLAADAGNVEAYLYADELLANADFMALSVSGTNFLYTAQDSATESVIRADLQVSTDLATWTTVADDDINDGVYTMTSPTNGFARVAYSLMWW